MNFVGQATRLTADDIKREAAILRCEAACVWAVCDVESAGRGFLSDKRPQILFEASIFSRLTGHKYDLSHPNISSRAWNRSLYGAPGAHQYSRLAEAMKLNLSSALESASWGMFQILGLNYGRCSFKDVEAFVNVMVQTERDQLSAFAEFCETGGLDKPLRTHSWTRFALLYNGAGEAANHYDQKLAAAYEARSRGKRLSYPGNANEPALIGLPLADPNAMVNI